MVIVIYIIAAIFLGMYVYTGFKQKKEFNQWMKLHLEHQKKLEELRNKLHMNIED